MTTEQWAAIWNLVTAPFPLFLIALVIGMCVVDHLHTRRRR